MITIVDYGLGNLASIKNMIKKIGGRSIITADPTQIASAEKLILPGVGAFGRGMENLHEKGLVEVLNQKVLEEKVPVLGICLGLQLMSAGSEEAENPGLGWIDADSVKFDAKRMPDVLKIPHMGWADIAQKKDSKLLEGLETPARFYHVHSYHLKLHTPEDELASATYGYEFTTIVEHENIMGCQFHAEKSHKFGMALMKNYIQNF